MIWGHKVTTNLVMKIYKTFNLVYNDLFSNWVTPKTFDCEQCIESDSPVTHKTQSLSTSMTPKIYNIFAKHTFTLIQDIHLP